MFWVDSSQPAAICTGEQSIVAVGATCLGSKCVTKLETCRRYILLGGNRIWATWTWSGCNKNAMYPLWAKYLNSPPIDVLFLFVPAFWQAPARTSSPLFRKKLWKRPQIGGCFFGGPMLHGHIRARWIEQGKTRSSRESQYDNVISFGEGPCCMTHVESCYNYWWTKSIHPHKTVETVEKIPMNPSKPQQHAGSGWFLKIL